MSAINLGRRHRASKACLPCRTRKLKCDVSIRGVPCSKCRDCDADCQIIPRKKRVTRPKPRQENASNAAGDENEDIEDSHVSVDGEEDDDEDEEESSSSLLDRPHLNRCTSHVSTTSTVRLSFSETWPQHRALHTVPHYPFLDSMVSSSQFSEQSLQDTLLELDERAGNVPRTSACGHDEIEYLRRIGAFDLPDHELIIEFARCYFNIFHPFFPILDKIKFMSSLQFSLSSTKTGPSLLLLHGVLMVSSAVVSQEMLERAGYKDRKEARRHFYCMARRLYEMDYEHDSITVIQTLLLISQYYPSITERKHTWHWVHQAISLAQGHGLHRHPGRSPDRALWARIWWACVVRDRCNGMGTGRPLMINSLDCSVPVLTIADLDEEGDTREDLDVKVMFIEFTKLCQCVEGVLTLQYSNAKDSREAYTICEESLQNWRRQLPSEAQLHSSVQQRIAQMYKGILHAAYNTLRITLLQSHALWEQSSQEAELSHNQLEDAALENTQLFSQLINLGLPKFCPTIAVTFTLAPLVVHVLSVRTAASIEDRQMYMNRFDMCMMFLRQLGNIYRHAVFYAEFFQLALGSVEKSVPTSPNAHESLSQFLRAPITLGHLLVLQRYQDEMKQGKASTSVRERPTSHTSGETHAPQDQGHDLADGMSFRVSNPTNNVSLPDEVEDINHWLRHNLQSNPYADTG